MEISVYLTDEKEQKLDGFIQVGTMKRVTENGMASFDVEEGEHIVRGFIPDTSYRGTTTKVTFTPMNTTHILQIKRVGA